MLCGVSNKALKGWFRSSLSGTSSCEYLQNYLQKYLPGRISSPSHQVATNRAENPFPGYHPSSGQAQLSEQLLVALDVAQPLCEVRVRVRVRVRVKVRVKVRVRASEQYTVGSR